MEKRAIMQPANAVLPAGGFADESLLAPHQAMVAFFARANLARPTIERVSIDDALGRVLAQPIPADDDYPNAARSAMDGFALDAANTPGRFEIAGIVVQMGAVPETPLAPASAMRIPTGGVLPPGANAVIPFEDASVENGELVVGKRLDGGFNVIEAGADMRRGEQLFEAGRRIGAPQIGVLTTLGVTAVPVYRRPVVAVISSGDELVEPSAQPRRGEIRDSNRYAVAASLRAMGAQPRHYPTLRDEVEEFEAALALALQECDGLAITGGSSVGERDRLPEAVASLGEPGIIVHGLRVKPGKPTLFGAAGGKPILGLPGNPTSALMMLDAVAEPIVAALTGAPVARATLRARLAKAAHSRLGWTWYVPVMLQHDGGDPLAHPLPVRSFSVSQTARADGYLVMGERDEEWPAGTPVTVHRFIGS
jgi:molybdenum cofactor synthesis domain-containing protein